MMNISNACFPLQRNVKFEYSVMPIEKADVKPHHCTECWKVFKHKTNLNIHKVIHTSNALVCKTCHKKFARKSNLEQHLRVHTNERYIVHLYIYVLYTIGLLLSHYLHFYLLMICIFRIVVFCFLKCLKRPYVCKECGRGFKQMHTLKDHGRIHTGERPYHCLQCGKAFKVKHNLIVHQRLHSFVFALFTSIYSTYICLLFMY